MLGYVTGNVTLSTVSNMFTPNGARNAVSKM